jgi:hypothetical protein
MQTQSSSFSSFPITSRTTPTGNPEFTKTIQDMTFMNYDPHATVQYPEEICVLISIGPISTHASPLRNERAECIFRDGAAIKTVFSTPKFPLPMPTPNGISFGMFASWDIKKGDLILVERPLILILASPYPTISRHWGF